MVSRKFMVRHNESSLELEYNTDHGLDVFKFQLFSLTFVPPEDQKILGGEDDRIVSEDVDLITVSDNLRLLSVNDPVNVESALCVHDSLKADEELARMLQAEEEALLLQEYIAGEDKTQMEQRIRPYVNQVLMYEDQNRQDAARKTVPVDDLEEKALVSLAKEGNFKPSKSEQDHAFLLQLLSWFKQSFRWVNSPPCETCANETVSQGMGVALPSEIHFNASRVELFRCMACSRITRFPRYNDPLKLVETRKGRCGEWANCFTLYCRAFDYDSRLILDFTDHVWTECYSHLLGRWMHLDPCEAVYDKPLLYEKGWNKNLNYAIAIAKDGVYDVTRRYSKKWHEVLSRRNIITEPVLSVLLSNITQECRRGYTSQMLAILEARERNEVEELERVFSSEDNASISLPGRQSGDKTWRILRQEFGSDDNCSVGCFSCPVRVCIDEHVTIIYNAYGLALSRFVKESLSKSRAVEVLNLLKGILVDLKKCPFRMRTTSIDSVSDSAHLFVNKMLPLFDEVLTALSIKSELGISGKLNISLACDPVKTSLVLPVALDALDNLIHKIDSCDTLDNDFSCMQFLTFNRMHSGSVLASGEEIPCGIATSAFDGIQLSKWEEPNGARGCWIIFRVFNDQMCELMAYELMSANDAPERDPMDWIVEGSSDAGSSWNVLDRQTSQIFENRFQHRTFTVKSEGLVSNMFRFRFLVVRDIEATSRLQLGSIDLYAKSI